MRLAVDFGTSNTAAAVLVNGRSWVIPLESDARTVPTALFFDPYRKQTLTGHAAVAALIDGREGRFLRALKSVLGTPLMREVRLLGGERINLIEVIARFLGRVKAEAERQCQTRFDSVLSGRPVRFHSGDAGRNAQAPIDLEEAYHLAGFKEVAFLAEPEAAAHAAGPGEGIGLIVDIGGGTSDFTLFRGKRGQIDILASHGTRIGGTDFDRILNLSQVMPLLGMGTEIGNEIGPGAHTAPQGIFHDLATWEKIPFLYSGEVRRMVGRMARLARDRRALGRLVEVLEMELGHDIAFAVERGKIAANATAPGWGTIDLGAVEKGLSIRLTSAKMEEDLADLSGGIQKTAAETLTRAGVVPQDVGRIVLVGGSSLMASVEAAMRQLFPNASMERGDAFTAVVDGLAVVAGREE